jgi:hypothetical protein
MIRQGESTNWWTSFYFWLLRIFTFYGNNIAILSLLGLSVLAYSLWVFLSTVIENRRVLEKTFLLTLTTPLFGVFGATVSHDVFQTSAILILLAVLWSISNTRLSSRDLTWKFTLASVLIVTTQTGIFTVAVCSLLLLVKGCSRTAIIGFLVALLISLMSNFGIGPSIIKHPTVNILLADMKCVVQHPDAIVGSDDWQFLDSIAPHDSWKKPMSCSNPDAITVALGTAESDLKLDSKLLKVYVKLLMNQPAIVMEAHLQRSLGALPPPFFQGPQNQVDLNIENPVGLGTNTALQLGPEILHPSIDEPSVASKISVLKPLEVIAQVPTFLINQASWFWGWGGLWLWPILGYYIYVLKVRNFWNMFSLLLPTEILHLSYLAIGPGPLGRYYFSTILAGFSLSIAIFLKSIHKDS